jgi:hypothetical protein
MIKKFNLYPSDQAKKSIEDIVEDMRHLHSLRGPWRPVRRAAAAEKPGSAFKVSFQ